MPVLYSAIRDSVELTKRASEGVFQGGMPNEVNASDPLALFVIQASFIIIFTRAIGYLLAKLKQPRVIAEIIGGIILGPSILGQIPNYMDDIFPDDSLPYLNLIGTLGIILFLFIVGMEVDLNVMKRYARSSIAIATTTLVIPLGAGIALGVGLWKEFNENDDVIFSHFILFIGVAIAITAFPVLCRILVEYKLTQTPVGTIALSAGVINDVVGWILLAVIVALVNSNGGIITLYILLVILGWILLLVFVVRPLFYMLARRTGSLDGGGPTQFVTTLALLLVFISSFITDIIGVHPIFGAFLVGLIMPKDGKFNIIVTEKIEDVVMIIFLPIYFGLTGIQTDLSLLNTGTIWGYTVLVIVVAFFSKLASGAVTAKVCRFTFRESLTIGTLMSCKGLVEIIVLNVGLQTAIIDKRVFSIMIFMAIVTTFITTPLALFIYPSKLRPHTAEDGKEGEDEKHRISTGDKGQLQNYLMVMQKMEHVPTMLYFTHLLQSEKHQNHIDALRLVELTERTSDSLRSETQEIKSDPLLGIFTTFAHLRNIAVRPLLSLTLQDNFVNTVSEQGVENDMVIVPWKSNREAVEKEYQAGHQNPIDTILNSQSSSQKYVQFVRKALSQTKSSMAIFLDQTTGETDSWDGTTLFMPFFGGTDDRVALKMKSELEHTKSNEAMNNLTEYSPHGLPDTIYPEQNTEQVLESETADDLALMECQKKAGTLGIEMKECVSAKPLFEITDIANRIKETSRKEILVIRKKTSKRTGLFERAKIKQKAKETRRKRSRDERRDPTWKNKKKKKADPGIPNSLPFKEEVLAEIEENRRRVLEAREAAKAAKEAGEDVDLSGSDDNEDVSDEEDAEDGDIPALVDASIATDAPENFGASVEAADVILEVLDARDPQGFRIDAIEKLQKKKKIVAILNKADLVPRETVSGWYNTLSSVLPTVVFASAAHIPPIEGFTDGLSSTIGEEALRNLLGVYAKEKKGKHPLKVLVSGLPNVGKSAILNTMIKQPYFKTASISTNSLIGAKNPTTTTLEISAVDVDNVIYIDSPGVSFIGQAVSPPAEILRRNLGRPDKVKEPQVLAEWILNRANEEDLMMFFKLPAFASGDHEAFFRSLANVIGRIKKRGIPDSNGAMRDFILKYVKYDIPYYTVAPPSNDKKKAKQIKGVSDVINKDIEKLAQRKPLRKARGEIRLVAAPTDSVIESREYIPTTGGPVEDDESEEEDEVDEDDEEEDDEEVMDVLDAEEDVEDDLTPDQEEELESPPPTNSKKRKERAPKVTFAKEVEVSDVPKKTSKKDAKKDKKEAKKVTPAPTKKAKVDEGVSAKQGLKGKKLDKVQGEAFDFNEFF
ncbi:hypothetical protein E3Q22_01388 [Wallemia mellicola]|uniref:Cation/H+ exchanger domain-containing protein n=1 Tax=Wallemia mellicola TaxID=1708541 RepID=A0A4T0Q1K3_9BASI|nr:hypothetical protein E3Q22_01388 [Wallemia mellicola]TIC04854.1 hypothetical protein E3Q16_02533 [Wallemia mellicola]TIC16994.1 hypothetical protein E3Q13_02674 [Wallemia mellicola]TIC42942.1 hypothetical protein E3Q08_02575 [Wallemia mellicola]